MKIILDECIPRGFKVKIKGHEVKTVPEMGWGGKKNGELLALIASKFDVFITVDRNLSFQNPTRNLQIGVIVLCSPSNRLSDLQHLVKPLEEKLKDVTKGKVVEIFSS